MSIYSIYDPFMEVSYQYRRFEDAADKADELECGRIHEIEGNARKGSYRKVHGQWTLEQS